MAEPMIAQRSPYAVELAPGDYWWCACGQSRRQPFCDGSHKSTEFTPVKFSMSRGAEGVAVRLQAQRASRSATARTRNCRPSLPNPASPVPLARRVGSVAGDDPGGRRRGSLSQRPGAHALNSHLTSRSCRTRRSRSP